MAEANRWTYLVAGSVKVDGEQKFARMVFTSPTPIREAEDIDAIEDMMRASYRNQTPPPDSVDAVMLWVSLLHRWYEPELEPKRADPRPS